QGVGKPAGRPAATHAVVAVPAAGDAPRLFARIVADARRLGASAIHIEPASGAGSAVRLRRDGTLVPYASLPVAHACALLAHIAVLGGLEVGARGMARHGTIRCGEHGLPDMRLAVTALASAAGEEAVLRIAPAAGPVPLARLGIAPDDLARLRGGIARARGLFLVAGPADAGKTTTLHALLESVNSPERKIWTAEETVTIVQPGLRQVPVGHAARPDFAGALRAFRHADPDVIMVGALRDRETAGLAMEAALEGRLVLAALPGRGAPEAALRLLALELDPFGAADALLGVLAQRLVKRLCTACRQAYHPGAAELDLLLTEYCEELQPAPSTDHIAVDTGAVRGRVLAGWRERHAGADGRFTLYRAAGCAECHGGYRGRAGLFELMMAGERSARLLAGCAGAAQLKSAALEDGMRTLKMDGIGKVLAGITDIRMVRAACAR
ncbi:GspE/PulE family protein, partial [Pseudoduganella dura]